MSGHGAYVHVPFCRERCDYCAFVTYTDAEHLHRRYVDAVLAEIARAEMAPACSLFFGGGTPSQLEVDQVAEIVEAVPLEDGAEVTLEANPEDLDEATVESLVAVGVTRISLGIQSTSPSVLASLGRSNRGMPARRLLELLSASGLESFSVDLIAGAAAETDEDLRRSIADVLDHDAPPPHVSCYLLSVERGTPLSRDPARHPDEDVLARRYEILDAELGERGLEWYELSNFSRPGHECRHNLLYWSQGDYVGFGPAAHGHRRGRRSWNLASLTAYLDAVEAGGSPEAGFEEVDDEQRRLEAVALGLRLREGIPRGWAEPAGELDGLLEERDERLVLTLRGRLLADAVLRALVVAPGAGQPAR